jgi:hypothetical protein
VARYALERPVIARFDALLERKPLLRLLGQLAVFAWIVQVTVEFRDAAWVVRVAGMILR